MVPATAVLGSLAVACSDLAGPARGECPGPYPDQAASRYILPWQAGETYRVGQGNCGAGSHAPGTLAQYSYDILMPIGTPVVAARDGTVLLVEDRFMDGTRVAGEENFINIVHTDGTIAGYVHLTRDGAFVSTGEAVSLGQIIGLSGDSGSSTQPHLHFHVQSCLGCPTQPVTFRNTRAHPGGLVQGESYMAGPF